MFERVTRHFGRLVFDRDAIVRAALRAYVEYLLDGIARFWYPASDGAMWEGDLQRGAIYNDNVSGDYEVVAWTQKTARCAVFQTGRRRGRVASRTGGAAVLVGNVARRS